MKAIVSRDDTKKFPIDLTIKIENEDQIRDLWIRFNMGTRTIHKTMSDMSKAVMSIPEGESGVGVWRAIDGLAIELGVRNDASKAATEPDDEDCDCVACELKRQIFGSNESPKQDKPKRSEAEILANMERTLNAIAKQMRETK